VTWRFRCRGSASLRRHKARFRARESGRELGTRSESPGGQFGLEYYELILIISFLLCKRGHLAAQSQDREQPSRDSGSKPSSKKNRERRRTGALERHHSPASRYLRMGGRRQGSSDKPVVPRRREMPGSFAVRFLRIVATAKTRGGFRLGMTADNELLEYPCGRRISSGSPWGRMVPAKIPRHTRMRSRVVYWSRLSASLWRIPLSEATRLSIPHRSGFGDTSVPSVRLACRPKFPGPNRENDRKSTVRRGNERVWPPVKDEAWWSRIARVERGITGPGGGRPIVIHREEFVRRRESPRLVEERIGGGKSSCRWSCP